MTQIQKVLDLLSKGWVSPRDAWLHCGCSRFSAAIFNLKEKGYVFEDREQKNVTCPSGVTADFKEFRLVGLLTQSTSKTGKVTFTYDSSYKPEPKKVEVQDEMFGGRFK